MAQSYAMIEDGLIINVCVWDGVTPFDPGDDITLTPIAELPAGAWIGWAKSAEGRWSPPADGADPAAA